MSLMRPVLVGLVLAAASVPQAALAQRPPLGFSISAGAAYQFEADLDDGGGVDIARFFVQPAVRYAFDPRNSIGVSIGYGETHYGFSGGASLGGGEPWDRIRDARLSGVIRFSPHENIDAIIIPSLRFNAEEGADFDDGRTEGVIAGASWRFSDRFTIGPGIGWFSDLDGGSSVFPFLIIDWEIIDGLTLATGGGDVGATQGPGLTLSYAVSDSWTVGVAGRLESVEFRLDDEGPAPGGIGEDSVYPLVGTASYSPNPFTRVSAFAGLELGGELTLRDANGAVVDRQDYDPAPVFGLSGALRF
jgi:hypothetical protein